MIKNNSSPLNHFPVNHELVTANVNSGENSAALFKNAWVVLPAMFILVLLIPGVRHRLDAEMYLKMLVQIPALTIAGFIIGLNLKTIAGKPPFLECLRRHGASSLVFLFGTQTFWMLPRSLDLSVYNEFAGLVLQTNVVAAGFLFGVGFKSAPFVLKTAFSIYGLSMALAMGIIYIHFNALICAVYTVEMQRVAGKYALYVFPFVFVLFLYRLFYNMARLTDTTT
jgi:hypothetical protein